jgi:hypothetical protein
VGNKVVHVVNICRVYERLNLGDVVVLSYILVRRRGSGGDGRGDRGRQSGAHGQRLWRHLGNVVFLNYILVLVYAFGDVIFLFATHTCPPEGKCESKVWHPKINKWKIREDGSRRVKAEAGDKRIPNNNL